MTFMRSPSHYVFILAGILATLPSIGSAKVASVTTNKIQAVKTTGKEQLFISGIIPLETQTGTMITDIRGATTLVMIYIQAILKEAGMDFNNVVKTTILLADLNNFSVVDEVYGSYFQDRNKLPARETFQPMRLPKDAVIEISMIAVK